VLLYVQYQDYSYDVVEAHALDKLLAGKNLRQFYRRSEERWVNVYRDPIRGLGGNYSGPNRRQSSNQERLQDILPMEALQG
jgi:hypothetical protein